MGPITHWDEGEREHAEEGGISGWWTDLGEAAGSVKIGVHRIEVDPGKRSTPLHMEGDEEEIFYVLGGSGLSWQYDGEDFTTYEIGAGDCLVHLAEQEAHSVVAGPDGIDVLAFGTRTLPRLTFFPRIKGGRMGPAWAEEIPEHQWKREAALGDPELPDPSPRPGRIVNLADVPEVERVHADIATWYRDLGDAAGSVRTGISHVRVAPGMLSNPPHCHSVEEELFLVLEGEGVCVLGDDEHPIHPGSVVSRPAATRVAHSFRAGADGLTMLFYGTREDGDIAYYPRSNKINFRGVGVIGRIEKLDYWDGEE
ncbi:MAG: cupin domain-containing protein [Actinomycetota bacterium]|nr:cupin domain-containing protein [Actinomycetota bacterium]